MLGNWLMLSSTLLVAGNVQDNNQPLLTEQASGDIAQEATAPQPTHWIDRWQENFTNSMNNAVRRLDSFFAPEGAPPDDSARAEGRIMLAWEPRSRDLMQANLRFRIRVTLPSLKDRVDLLLSDNEDETQDNMVQAARNTDMVQRDSTTLAVRFRPEQDSPLSYRIGAGRRDQLYAKVQFEDTAILNSHWAARYDSEVYYYTRDRLGAELGLSLQYASEHKGAFRFNNRFYFRDNTNDWLWRHELQWLQPISQHHALLYSAMTEGLTQPNYRTEEVYGGIRWRTNYLRDWLYFEVEPYVIWLRDEDFSPSYGIALRLEAFYGKRS
ncbi:hypothetical protein [Alteromonas sp. CYL-A6]|uniref:hypothetical protein n=1 Tax=Alteromonas nitratireducens TaxID=3390813 RepID=UPI0034A6C896